MVEFSTQHSRLPLLSLLRWVSSVFVLFWHYQIFLIYKSMNIYEFRRADLPFFKSYQFLFNNSFNSVGVFWALSGILISSSYTSSNKSRGKFIRSRIIKLYPLAVLSLGLTTMLQLISMFLNDDFLIYKNNSIKNFFLNLLLINFGDSYNGPIYSLTLEIPIYLTFLLIFLEKRNKNELIRNSVIILLSFGLAFSILDYKNVNTLFILVFLCGFHFYSGVFFQIIGNFYPIKYLFLICIAILTIGFLQEIQTLQSIGLVGLILSLDIIFKIKNLFLKNFLELLGNVTYASFLFHIPIQITIILTFTSLSISNNIYSSKWFLLLYFMIVQFIILILYRFVQQPITKLFKHIIRE